MFTRRFTTKLLMVSFLLFTCSDVLPNLTADLCNSRLSHLIHNLSECLIYITTLWIRALTPRLENTA